MNYDFNLVNSADGNSLTSGHHDGSLKFWDISRSGQCIHTIDKLHTAHITSLQYNPKNNCQILTSSKDNTLRIVDTRNYATYKVLLLLISILNL
jgi:WD40 repeat protein